MATPNLTLFSDPRSAAAEAYRTLRTNLIYSSAANPIHTLLVTAAAGADGKSDLIANLALAFAQGGHSTILVDADLRKPSQHELWGIPSEHGLTSMMLDDVAMSNPPLIATNVDKLQILPAGPLPPNPADLLSSQRMDSIIGVLKARASFVLFDVAPVLAASDAAALGTKVDAALLVVRAGTSQRTHVSRAKESLERVHVRLLGAVLSNAPRESDSVRYG